MSSIDGTPVEKKSHVAGGLRNPEGTDCLSPMCGMQWFLTFNFDEKETIGLSEIQQEYRKFLKKKSFDVSLANKHFQTDNITYLLNDHAMNQKLLLFTGMCYYCWIELYCPTYSRGNCNNNSKCKCGKTKKDFIHWSLLFHQRIRVFGMTKDIYTIYNKPDGLHVSLRTHDNGFLMIFWRAKNIGKSLEDVNTILKKYKATNSNLFVSIKRLNEEKIKKKRKKDCIEDDRMVVTKIQDFKTQANNLDVRRKTLNNYDKIIDELIDLDCKPENTADYFIEYNQLQVKRREIFQSRKETLDRIYHNKLAEVDVSDNQNWSKLIVFSVKRMQIYDEPTQKNFIECERKLIKTYVLLLKMLLYFYDNGAPFQRKIQVGNDNEDIMGDEGENDVNGNIEDKGENDVNGMQEIYTPVDKEVITDMSFIINEQMYDLDNQGEEIVDGGDVVDNSDDGEEDNDGDDKEKAFIEDDEEEDNDDEENHREDEQINEGSFGDKKEDDIFKFFLPKDFEFSDEEEELDFIHLLTLESNTILLFLDGRLGGIYEHFFLHLAQMLRQHSKNYLYDNYNLIIL